MLAAAGLFWQSSTVLGLSARQIFLLLGIGTVPVFLRLRRLRETDLDFSLAAFVDRELRELSGGKLPAELGRLLWERGRLLLLLDGLDEVADDVLRGRVCRFLEWGLEEAADAARQAGFTTLTVFEKGMARQVPFN